MNKVLEYERITNQAIISTLLKKEKLIPLEHLSFLKKLWHRAYAIGADEEREIIKEEGV